MQLQQHNKFFQVFTITPRIYKGFIALFKDQNPLHVDSDFATKNGFIDRVMHGNILNGFLSYFIGECLPIKNVIIHSQEICYKNPVYLHDTLNFEATITEIHEAVNAVIFKFIFKNSQDQIVSKGKIQIGIL